MRQNIEEVNESRLIYLIERSIKCETLYYPNKAVVNCNNVVLQELLDNCFESNLENNAWNLEHNENFRTK